MQYQNHKNAHQKFKDIEKNPDNYLIIHYSCESFYDIKDGHSPRITSIAVFDYATAQTDSFSIHKSAEKSHIELCDIETNYDNLERKMLDEFFDYAKSHQNYFWIHWNMRDINYGFKAIEHRYCVLGGEPYKIPDHKKIDLARELINYYGVDYIGHPRMENILKKNDIKAKDYLSGKEEAVAFEQKEYVKLHISTLRKVNVFYDLLNRVINNTLKVNSKWSAIYGVSIQGLFNYCKENWLIQVVLSLLSMILGGLISYCITVIMS